MWTVEKIIEICNTACNKCDISFDGSVVINGRLKRTLGRCHYEMIAGLCYPTKIEISKSLLELAEDSFITDVILHECAHYITTAITHENHGHDAVFKHFCLKIGTYNYTRTAHKISYKQEDSHKSLFKYSIYCEKCKQLVENRSRACKLTKNPEFYRSKCCDSPLKVEQNWQKGGF